MRVVELLMRVSLDVGVLECDRGDVCFALNVVWFGLVWFALLMKMIWKCPDGQQRGLYVFVALAGVAGCFHVAPSSGQRVV